MIGRLTKNCRPVLDAFEKELSTDVADPKQIPRHAECGFFPVGATREQRQCSGHLRHAGQMSCSTPATKSQAHSGSGDRQQGQPKMALPVVIGTSISVHARCFVKVRLDEASTWQRVAQHLDKSSTGNLIAVLAIVGELKGQIAGGRQALPEGSGGHFTVSIQFHDPYNHPSRTSPENPSAWSDAKEILRRSMPEGGMRIDIATCSLCRCRSALRRADRAASTPQWIRCTGASARRRRPS